MGVAMKQKFRPPGMRRRDMDKKKLPPKPLQNEMPGKIQGPVIVSQDPVNRRTHCPHRRNGGQITKIPQMPNLVGLTQPGHDGNGQIPMGVGNNRNMEESFQFSVFSFQADFRGIVDLGLSLNLSIEHRKLKTLSPMWKTAHEHVLRLIAYEPGKPVEELAREMGLRPSDIVKLASNENPLGPSPLAIAAMRDALERAHFYPDGGGWALRNAIAEKLDLHRENVLLGNGSNEIIEFIGHAFLRPGDEVVTARHAFAVYTLMSQLFGATTVEVPDPGYTHDLEAMLAAISPRTRQVFIANPNNPTGTLVGQDALDRFMDQVPEHVLVIFDEAYHEFLENPPDTLKFVREGRNVLVMRTFSKIQGLANLRIGYGLTTKEIAEVLQKTRQPFNANGIAQAGALAGLDDEEHMRKTRELTHEGRALLEKEFAAMGLEYVPSAANFVLVRVGDGDKVFAHLLKRGLIVRAMRSYKMPEWIRVSVGTMEQNQRFLTEFKELDAAGLIERSDSATS